LTIKITVAIKNKLRKILGIIINKFD
jgi:hypothetical protein